jgi:hypothetical protein
MSLKDREKKKEKAATICASFSARDRRRKDSRRSWHEHTEMNKVAAFFVGKLASSLLKIPESVCWFVSDNMVAFEMPGCDFLDATFLHKVFLLSGGWMRDAETCPCLRFEGRTSSSGPEKNDEHGDIMQPSSTIAKVW